MRCMMARARLLPDGAASTPSRTSAATMSGGVHEAGFPSARMKRIAVFAAHIAAAFPDGHDEADEIGVRPGGKKLRRGCRAPRQGRQKRGCAMTA